MMIQGVYKNVVKPRIDELAGRLERWATYGNVAEAFLILVNGLLVIKSSANLSSILIEDPDSLILEFNGHLLLNESFRLMTILINLLVFLTSLLSLMVILFTMTPQDKKHKLIRYSVALQLALAFLVLILMGRLWFCPLRIELDRGQWDAFVDDYEFKQPPPSHHQYLKPFDRLQQALACCGYRSSTEWISRRGLLAPSCCSNPLSGPDLPAAGSQHYYYCASSEQSARIDSNGLQMPDGCQQRLLERDSRFMFGLRMRLLLLLAALFLMAQASFTFYLPAITPPLPDRRHQVPPHYWHALGGLVLVDTAAAATTTTTIDSKPNRCQSAQAVGTTTSTSTATSLPPPSAGGGGGGGGGNSNSLAMVVATV